MIASEYCRVMARYNGWQNRSLYGAADSLTEAQRREDRGAFFGSVHGTLCHLLWGDTFWMSRFDGWPAPPVGIAESAAWLDWPALKAARAEADVRIADWASRLTEVALARDFPWQGSSGVRKVQPLWLLVTHFFNHQTHHRGQVHALLTALGARPDATDLVWMPDLAETTGQG